MALNETSGKYFFFVIIITSSHVNTYNNHYNADGFFTDVLLDLLDHAAHKMWAMLDFVDNSEFLL